jgi:hypothetical protein
MTIVLFLKNVDEESEHFLIDKINLTINYTID